MSELHSNAPIQTDPVADTIIPQIIPGEDLFTRASLASKRASEFLFSIQRPDLHWCAELESNATITSEYVLLNEILGLKLSTDRKEKIARYLLTLQKEDGSWAIASHWKGDLSTTAEVYLALRILGYEVKDPVMLRAQNFILREGGLEKVRVFTRISFAMFGLMPWSTIPAIPPELILLPPQAPVNVYALSSWARGTMIPLFVICHYQPLFALPNGKFKENPWLDHLWSHPEQKQLPAPPSWLNILKNDGLTWKTFFGLTDILLKNYETVRLDSIRETALTRCIQWILERQEESGDWAGIFPPMLNGIIALSVSGHAIDSPPILKGLRAVENFSWEDAEGFRIQACVSPVWDTALSAISLLDAENAPQSQQIKGAIQWILDRQLIVSYGDWKVYRPDLPPGGWSFEYSNSWYPDIDDTAAVLLSVLKQNPQAVKQEPVIAGLQWLLGMQNKDGGWAAFDVNNDKLFLNSIPFADIDALCDPSSPDVAGRVLESLGLFLELSAYQPQGQDPQLLKKLQKACQDGIQYLRKSQEPEGSWFGRWGVNYIYGTSNVLCGLARLKVPASDPMIDSALHWLKRCQRADGGWGESIGSYLNRNEMGKGDSTPSQTAWALMGLLGYLPPQDHSIQKGIHWLIDHQVFSLIPAAAEGGSPLPQGTGYTWEETQFTGTGFPKHFYLRYHLYRHYFPLMALGRFVRAHQD